MLNQLKRVSAISFLVFLWTFPVTVPGPMAGFDLADSAHALSSQSMPLGSNIFVEIAKEKNPAVVNISIRGKTQMSSRTPRGNGPRFRGEPREPFQDFYDRFFGQQDPQPRRGMGSGFIISPEGLVLTNYHVVQGAEEIIVNIDDGGAIEKEYEATLVGSDPKTDIALIKLVLDGKDKVKFPHLDFGDSDKLEVGEWVMAIGNPFGLSHTVTVGVVSAKDRAIGSGPYDEFIQTDASINPGNSGGPLLNIKGQVIGMNTAIISGSTGGNVGIGFAIPINMVKSILPDLKEKGTVTRGWLGVMIQKITPELKDSFNLKSFEGALVGDVIPGGPAEAAGIKRGDVIVRFGKEKVDTMESLPKIVAATPPGEAVDVKIIRDGKPMNISVTIAVLKDEETKVAALDPLGIQTQDITPELMQSMNLETTEGVLVSDVTPGESGGEAGLRRGDIITEVNRKPVTNVQDYQSAVRGLKSGDTALMLVKRGGTTIYIAVKLN
ncbi:Serine protease Do [Nitrospina gracilis 3/211]|uniref:Probable periplasmic serine endoprotease DegP-like n=1 Tax=Nitrospina gracilis (strain 3/211) TaxID=1266370 RepID=M1YNF4_NITG3|nr:MULTISPECIES: DegQ family serine endoprotease [Nitrospina]MCF8724770.1 serine protease Do [Nitrospina sp. Nb-3]CCQ92045.1 Serine protease Do [Nitrospina gracilis 3/211]